MSVTEQTGNELFDTLNRFDEIAIAQVFGSPVIKLASEDEVGLTRALIFVDLRRSGKSDHQAREEAFNLPMVEVLDYFAEEPIELDPADPDSEPGKDD